MKAYLKLADDKSYRRFNLLTDRELCTVDVNEEDLQWFGRTWFRQTREAYLAEGLDKRLTFADQPTDSKDEPEKIAPKQRKAKPKISTAYRTKLRPRANGKAVVERKKKPGAAEEPLEEAIENFTVTPEEAYQEALKLDAVDQHMVISTKGNPRTVCGHSGFEI